MRKAILRRLAVFAGPFSLKAAAVADSPELSAPDVIEGLLGLVAKSLVAAEGESAVARYRLLDTTRAYALEKLEQSGERERLAHTIGICSNRRKSSGKRSLRSNGSTITVGASTIYVRRSTGPFRRAVTH